MHFFIPKYSYDIYGAILTASFIFSYFFIYVYLRNKKVLKKDIIKSIFLSFIIIFLSGKILAYMFGTDIKKILFSFAVTGYGGAIGLFISIFIFQKIFYNNKKIFMQAYILIIPLIYSISKLGCFLIGCCRGIRYNGFFSVSYYNNFGPYFPIQLVETIVFFIIFLIAYLFKNNKYYIELVIFLCAIAKFLLDYLRMSHTTQIISINQIISIIFIIISIILFIKKTKFQKN